MKLDPYGNVLWTQYYNGNGSSTDVASAVAVSNSGDVYVTGASMGGAFLLMDMVTLMYDTNGNLIWSDTYDYSGAMDIPTSISLEGGDLIVSGSSGTTFSNYDFCTIKYDASTGAQTNVLRTANLNPGAQDMVSSMTTDSLGNVYVLGTTFNGSDYDVQLQKLDTSLNVMWTQTFDGYGYDDAGVNLALDDSLYIYVTGYTGKNATGKNLLVLKYANNGILKFVAVPKINGVTDSEGWRIMVKSDDEIFVGGNFTYSNQDVGIMRFNKHGRNTLFKTYNGAANGTDKFMDLTFGSGNQVYVSARTFSAGVDYNTVIRYSYRDIVLSPATSVSSGAKYADKEVIAGFIKPVLKMNRINDPNKQFGQLHEFVQDSTCDKITALLDPDGKKRIYARSFPVRKIFLNMTDADTLSESRLGDYVPVPPFYTKLLVTLPTGVSTENTADSLKLINPDLISSQLNFLYEPCWAPNDTLYSNNQFNLHPTGTYPNAHISMQRAWDYTKGSSFIRVGVYDTGIDTFHLDITGRVKVMKNYTSSSAGDYDFAGHGTRVASVIGAKSNNVIGMAGVAGGDVSAGSPGLNDGITLANMKVLEHQIGLTTTAILIDAYKEGADGTNLPNGLALHVTNHSYGRLDNAYDDAMTEGINYMNSNGVAFVAARGNAEASPDNYSLNQSSSPACILPGKVMNVGASGTDGHYHKKNVNGTAYSSMVGYNLDFLAPGSNIPVIKPFPVNPVPSVQTTSIASTYTTANGTSVAAPHVSGVIALMMSYRNHSTPHWDNLTHEDCEALLKRTATDLVSSTYTETLGQDSTSGWGRIKADSALHAVQFQYKIRHIDKNHYATSVSTTTSMIASNVVRFFSGFATGPLTAGNYTVNIVEVTTTYSYPFGSEIYLDSWPLYKASRGYPSSFNFSGPINAILTNDPNHVEIVSSSLTSATVKTYLYYFINKDAIIPQPVNTWVPINPANHNTAFTLYTLGEASTGIQTKESDIDYLNVYPNPSTGYFTMGFNSKKASKGKVNIYDVMGRCVYENAHLNVNNGINRPDLNLEYLPNGIYFLSLDIEGNKTMVKKLVIN